MNNNQQAFFTLVQAGLWGKEVRLSPLGKIDFSQVLSLAEEQSVVGLVAAGIEQVHDTKVAKAVVLQLIGQSLQLEQQNSAMNRYIGDLLEKMRAEGVDAILVKGQGIAQCYEKPLWRSCGDIDLLLDEENYDKAKTLLTPIANRVGQEDVQKKHYGVTVHPWEIELHGTLHSELSRIIDSELDQIQQDTLENRNIRVWQNNTTTLYLPAPNNDVIFVFVHILQHFFKGGIGLRQICDWCRLMWTYRSEIDAELLEQRLTRMGLMTEWKAFASLAVSYLAMPVAAMPLYSNKRKWKRKADQIAGFVLETGNFGHNRDTSYLREKPYLIRKSISLWHHTRYTFTRSRIFPLDSLRMWGRLFTKGMKVAVKGK